MVQRHIWSEYLDLVELLRKTERGKALYAKRKESIERVFGDAKEKHAMQDTGRQLRDIGVLANNGQEPVNIDAFAFCFLDFFPEHYRLGL